MSVEMIQLIEYATLQPNQIQGWWWNGLPNDGSVYAVTAYPLGVAADEQMEVPDIELEVQGLTMARWASTYWLGPGPLSLGFSVKNKSNNFTYYCVNAAKII